MGESTQVVWVKVGGEKILVKVGDLRKTPITVVIEEQTFEVEIGDPFSTGRENFKAASSGSPDPGSSSRRVSSGGERMIEEVITAPMPGDIVKIMIQPGQKVNAGDALCILDAMKMKNTIHAPQPGTITSVEVQLGQSVDYGVVLFTLK